MLYNSGSHCGHNFKSAHTGLILKLLAQLLPEVYSTWSNYVPVNSKTAHPPPPGNPWAFDSS